MKKLFNRVLFSKSATAFFTALSAVSVLIFYSVRYGFVFVDNVLYTGFSLGLFVFTAIGYVCLLTVLNAKVKRKFFIPEKYMNVIAFISEALSVIVLIYSIVAIITDKGMSLSSAFELFRSAFPIWLIIVGISFLHLHFRLSKIKTQGVLFPV